MPLDQSPTKAAIGRNIAELSTTGRPRAQQIAIALDTARRNGADIPKKKPTSRYRVGASL